MKKATILLLVAMLVSAAVTFVSTNAKATDDCECWFATWNGITHICVYYFCLVPQGEVPSSEEYVFHYFDPVTQVQKDIPIGPESIPSPCESPCVLYSGFFIVEHDPRAALTWWVTNADEELVGGSGTMDNCFE